MTGRLRDMLRHRIRQRLQLCKNRSSTVEEVVDYLRSTYPHDYGYGRIRQKPFASMVRKAIESLSDKSEDEEEELLRRKKKRLRKMEVSQLPRKCLRSNQGTTSSDSNDEDGGDGAVSTSEGGIYEQKMGMVDLTKIMLRTSYSRSEVVREEEKSFEVDVVTSTPQIHDAKDEPKAKGRGSTSQESTATAVERNEGVRFQDFAGIEDVIKLLKRKVILPLAYPNVHRALGVKSLNGILLYGPPGCGKSTLVDAIANETGLPYYKITATEVVTGVSGASEENIRNLFDKAQRNAPSIVFIDEIDAIAAKRENLQRGMECRVVTELMSCMDRIHRPAKPSQKSGGLGDSDAKPGYVVVVGATNRPDAIDPALRRPGRFDCEIALRVPGERARAEILSVLTRDVKLEGSIDLMKIARSTPGYVGADLGALVEDAKYCAAERIVKERMFDFSDDSLDQESTMILATDIEDAMKNSQPSLTREGFAGVPNVKWEDIGGLDSLRQALDQYIVKRIKYAELYERVMNLQTGFLLFGPPGCGKTLIAKAVATEAGANFIYVKGSELLNKYVGESEAAVRRLFDRARACTPCIIFFDEVDALTEEHGSEGGQAIKGVLRQLLIELDGGDDRRGVFVIGATNRIEVVDRAILRSGRLGKLHYVGLPSQGERASILKALVRRREIPLHPDVDLDRIAGMEACENLSGSDLAALMDESVEASLKEICGDSDTPWTVNTRHFEHALSVTSPTVSKRDVRRYGRLAKKFISAK